MQQSNAYGLAEEDCTNTMHMMLHIDKNRLSIKANKKVLFNIFVNNTTFIGSGIDKGGPAPSMG